MDIAPLHALSFGLGCTLHLLQSIIGPVKLGALTSNELMRLIRELWVISASVCMTSWFKPTIWLRCQSAGWEDPKWWPARRVPSNSWWPVHRTLYEYGRNWPKSYICSWMFPCLHTVGIVLFTEAVSEGPLHRWSWFLDERSAGKGSQIPNT